MNTESKVLIAIAAVITVAASVLLIMNGTKDEKPAEGGELVRSDSIQTNPEAKVTVVEFGDLQCPACAAAQSTVQEVKKQFGDKINFVWRHFPLAIHPNAQAAANASEAANAEGKFFEYADVLFKNQNTWSEASSSNAIQLFVKYGSGLEVSGAAIEKAVKDRQYEAKIKQGMADGEALGVNSTPTFFVNGKQVQTAGLLEAVRAAVSQQK